jgi:hypothetical protein
MVKFAIKYFDKLFDINNGYININNILSLSKNTFTEVFDENKLIFILNNLEKIKIRENARNLPILDSYLLNSDKGKIKVTYNQKPEKELYGRYWAKGCLSGQNMLRECRHSIFDDYYIDLDINNCHPNIILWMCLNMDIKYNYLNQYINDREEIINDLIKLNPTKDKGFFKFVFLAINNGGDKDYKTIIKNDFIKNYFNEMINIRKLICNKLFKFTEKTKEFSKDDYNIEGKTISNICTFVENQLLLEIINYLKKKLRKEEFQQSILCFDGIMLRKNVCSDIDIYIKEIEDYFNKMGIQQIKLSIKQMSPLNLVSMGYDPMIKYKINKPKEEIIEPEIKSYNSFSEDDYYFNDLCKYFDRNVFDIDDFEPIQYLINNLHRVLALVNRNIIIKQSKDEYFVVSKFKAFTEQEVHFTIQRPKFLEHKYINLSIFINRNKKYFKLFNSVRSDYYFDCPDQNTFIMSRKFIASYNPNYINSKKLNTLLKFIKTNLFSKNEDMFKFELQKLSIMIKYPHLKTGIITLLISTLHGCGKNLYTDFLCDYVFGEYNTISNLSGLDTLLEDKNGMQCGKKMVVVNEMSSTKEKFMSNFNKFKNMITEKKQRMRFMYADGYMADQSTEYYCLSNHKNSYVIENKKSRREFVPDVDESYSDNKKYFAPIRKAILNQECGDMFYSYLKDMTITYDEFMSINVPMSKTKEEIVNNYKPTIIELIEIIEATEVKKDNEEWGLVTIYDRYKKYCEESGVTIKSRNDCSSKLKNYGYKFKNKNYGLAFLLNIRKIEAESDN